MKSYPEYFQDSIDLTDGSVTMVEKDYLAIQSDARAELLQQIEELRRDKERLDYTQKHFSSIVLYDKRGLNCISCLKDLRQAIDAAMKEEK